MTGNIFYEEKFDLVNRKGFIEVSIELKESKSVHIMFFFSQCLSLNSLKICTLWFVLIFTCRIFGSVKIEEYFGRQLNFIRFRGTLCQCNWELTVISEITKKMIPRGMHVKHLPLPNKQKWEKSSKMSKLSQNNMFCVNLSPKGKYSFQKCLQDKKRRSYIVFEVRSWE